MYNHSIILDYQNSKDDNIYRKQLLYVFQIDTINSGKLHKEMDEIYNKIKEYIDPLLDILKEKMPYPFDIKKEDYLAVLFSWEYFYLTHELIREIYNNDDKNAPSIKEKKNKLSEKIMKNLEN